MESILNIIVNAENVRMLAIIAIVCSGYVRLSSKMDRRINELKYNVNTTMEALKNTIEALTYALEKNGSLKPEDKAYVDSRLAH